MANATNKDQFVLDYERQRLSFIEALKRFNSNKGTPFQRPPEIGGRPVDLYHLYQKVTSMGGWHKVNHDQLWERILSDFWLPQACTNAAEVLKHIYFRYLNLYEKVNFLGEDVDTRKNDDEDGPTRKKICLPIESIPLSYNYNQHKLTDAQRQQHNLCTDVKKRNPYEKLELSLQSGLPNDVDHAVNVCVLLSTEGRHTIDLHKTTCLVELLLAHIGVFEEDMFLEELYSSCWTDHTGRDFLRFWYESVKRKDIRALITYKGVVYSQREMAGEQVLNLGRDIGVGDNEGQRVLQMAVFFRNLSFEECNQQILASSGAIFKFLILCLYNTYGNLRQMALDTLANLACELSLISVDDLNTQLMLDFIHDSLVSEDRFCLVRGMEFMSKIMQPAANMSVLSNLVRNEAYSRLVDLLTIQDIQIIVHSLEALYKLSKAGEPFTTKIAKVHKAIDILVSLITIEAQSFGPGSLVGIKVVEYVPPVSSDDRDMAKRPTTVIQPVNPDCINIYQIPSSQLSQSTSAEAKDKQQPAPAPKPRKPVTDIHATSSSWLKATFELKKRSKVNQVELFSEYLQFCRKFGIQNTLSSADFLQMVKTIFDQVEVLSIHRKNGDRDVFFEGLCKRPTQRPFAVTTIQEDKVDRSVCANVSPQQTPQSTLRQRLMEPLRHSFPPQLTHTGAAANPATPNKTVGPANNVKVPPPQASVDRKSGRVIIPPPQPIGVKRKTEGMPPNQQTLPSGPTDTSSDVKSLLAKKLCHGTAESNTNTSAVSQHSSASSHPPFISNTVTSQPFNTSQHAPGTFVVCPAVTSSPTNPSHRPVYQQGRSLAATSDSWCNKPTGVTVSQAATPQPSQVVSTVPSLISSQQQPNNSQPLSQSHLPSASTSSSLTVQSGGHINPNVVVQSTMTSSTTDIVKYNNAQQSIQVHSNGIQSNNTVTIDNNTTVVTSISPNSLHNGGAVTAAVHHGPTYSVIQPNNPNSIINSSMAATPATAQTQQQISLQTIPQQVVSTSLPASSGLSMTPQQLQGSTTIPVIPQPPHQNVMLPGTNLINVGHPTAGIVQPQQPQQQTQQFVSQSNPSISLNQLIRTPSNPMQASANAPQAPTILTPNNIVSMGTASVTQSMSAPAMLNSGNQQIQQQQQQQQMVLSTPLQQGTISGAAPNSVVIQTQPGAIVVPPRQVVVQGNMGAIQQNVMAQQQPGGTVSFVVPQYRQTSNLIIQQSGAVNMVPSLTLQTQQPNPTPQTLTGHVSTTPLGTRQIIINQSQLPVGMQISSIQGNSGNVVMAPQQQPQPANIVIQQPANQILSQPPPSANNLQLTVNGNQVVMKESLPSSNINASNQILPQQQEHVMQMATQLQQQQQQQNQQQPNNTQLVIQTSQPNVQPDQLLSKTSPQCNGVNHEVNGVLGSPDSMSSDLPPSPQSTGLQSDILNGQLSDSDSNKSDLAKLVDKSGRPKLNGIVHSFENGCYTNSQQPPPPAKISPNSISKSSTNSNVMQQQSGQDVQQINPRLRIVNGSGPTGGNSASQQTLTGSDAPTNGPQRIIVNVVQRQTPGNGVSVNGGSQPQQTGNVVLQQQQQMTNPPNQQQIANPSIQQQQSNNAPRVVVNNNNSVQQQQQNFRKGRIIIQQPPPPPPKPVIPSSHRPQIQNQPQNRISTLPPNPASSSPQTLCNTAVNNVTNSPVPSKVSNQQSPVISKSGSCDSGNTIPPPNKLSRPAQQVNQANVIASGTKRKAAIVAMTDKTPVRLRGKKKGEGETGAGADGTQGKGQKPVSIVLEYKCEWGTCRRNFTSAKRVFLHVFRHHIPKAKESCCQWLACEKMVRKRWSLVSHIQDYHCTEMAMRSACHKRFTLSQNPNAQLPPPPPQPMLYPPDAASQAIRRFIIKPPFPEFAEQREGPVSKHIRLTAALILRNVCHHSPLGRKLISRHEQQINYNCMNPMDASTALSSCLWDILHYGEPQYKSNSTQSHLLP